MSLGHGCIVIPLPLPLHNELQLIVWLRLVWFSVFCVLSLVFVWFFFFFFFNVFIELMAFGYKEYR